MTPEVMVLLINAAGLALAYGDIYPRLLPMSMGKMVLADAVVTVVLVGIAVAWFWGSGTQFWLLGWYVGPAIFFAYFAADHRMAAVFVVHKKARHLVLRVQVALARI